MSIHKNCLKWNSNYSTWIFYSHLAFSISKKGNWLPDKCIRSSCPSKMTLQLLNRKHLWPAWVAWVWPLPSSSSYEKELIWVCICSLWVTQCYTSTIWAIVQSECLGLQDNTAWPAADRCLLCCLSLTQFGQQSMVYMRISIKYVFGWINEWVLGACGETPLWVFHLIFLLSVLVRCEHGALVLCHCAAYYTCPIRYVILLVHASWTQPHWRYIPTTRCMPQITTFKRLRKTEV